MIEPLNKRLEFLKENLSELRRLLNIDDKREEIKSLQVEMSENRFWNEQKSANKKVERLKRIKADVDNWQDLNDKINDLEDLTGLSDSSYEKELVKEVTAIEERVEKFRLKTLLSGKFDQAPAYVEINAGAGGTEACDWVEMLFRMYFRWAEEKKFKIKVIDELRGEEAGYKNITFLVDGVLSYGYLKSERGVHRLVRISPFDANKRRHTSFASVAVYPEIKDDVAVDIKSDEIKVDTFKAGGCGGQHVNVTDSAVRITHLPTGIVVSCQNERSQHQNKQVALAVLAAKLYELKESERKEELSKMTGNKRKIEWGSQIRSYVLCPYLLVKDHRTNFEDHDAWSVLDGDLDGFMITYLKSNV
ncbi:MAG: peptide chain release factor 2 [Candidatus Omnitrophota bacterium]